MDVYDTYVGNTSDDVVAARLAEAETVTVTVDDDQRRRSRFRAETDAGTDVGVVLSRTLRAGDVLSTGADDGPLLEVTLEPIEALVVDLADAEDDLPTAVALGHATGNRHWEMAVRGQAVLFPASEPEERLTATVEPHLPDGATVGSDTVPPGLFDDEGGPGHAHGHGTDSHHDHGAGHDHSHDEQAHIRPGENRDTRDDRAPQSDRAGGEDA